MSGTLAPSFQQRFFDANGLPLAGGYLWSYVSGTSTPLAIYTDAGLTVAYTNPVQLDAEGYPGPLYFQAASYKLYLTDASGVPVGPNGGYTDPVAATSLAASPVGGVLFVFGGEEESIVTVTNYPSGTTYDKCHASTGWFSVDSANLVGTYALQGQLRGVGGTVTAGVFNLSDGTPDTALATISSSSSTGERQVSGAITFAATGAAKVYAVKTKVSAGVGYAWSLMLVKLS